MELHQKDHFRNFANAIKDDVDLVRELIRILRAKLQPNGEGTNFSVEHYPLVMSYILTIFPNHKIYAKITDKNSGSALERQFANFRIDYEDSASPVPRGAKKYAQPYFAWLCDVDKLSAKKFYNNALEVIPLSLIEKYGFRTWKGATPSWAKVKPRYIFKSEEQIRRWIENPSSRDEIENIKIVEPELSTLDPLDPYNNKSIKFVGRENEIQKLNGFVDDPAEFKIWAVIAPSGAGKTRLTFEWTQRPAIKKYWTVYYLGKTDTGRLHFRNPDQTPTALEDISEKGDDWTNWSPGENEDTVFVVDYVFGYREVIEGIVQRCLSAKEPLKAKVRLLVLDHIFPKELDNLKSDVRWAPVEKNIQRFNLFYDEKPLVLTKTPDQREIIPEIIRRSANADATPNTEIYVSDEEMDDAIQYLEDTKGAWHPLFAILVGEAIKNNEPYKQWNRQKLIYNYLSGKDRIPWESPSENEAGMWTAAFICTATARRGVLWKDLLNIEYAHLQHFPFDFSTIRNNCEHIISKRIKTKLHAFEPDILGESFFLLFLEKIENVPEVARAFDQLLSTGNEMQQIAAVDEILGFMQRLIRNLVNDDPSIEQTQEHFRRLYEFLEPSKFPYGSPFRWVMWAALFEIVDQIIRSEHRSKFPYLFDYFHKMSFENLINTIPAEMINSGATVVIRYFEWISGAKFDYHTDKSHVLKFFQSYDETRPDIPILHQIAKFGSVEMVQNLLDAGFYPHAICRANGMTPLMYACAFNQDENVASILLNNMEGCDHIDRNFSSTALMFACLRDKHTIAIELIEKMDEVDQQNKEKMTALMYACNSKNQVVLGALVKKMNDVSQQDDAGFNALMFACANGLNETALILISKMNRFNHTAEGKLTALMYACKFGREKVALAMIKEMKFVDQQSAKGMTALMFACASELTSVALALIPKMKTFTQQTNDGHTALIMSIAMEQDEVSYALIDVMDDFEHGDDKGNTALTETIRDQNDLMSAAMIRNGANINRKIIGLETIEGGVPIIIFVCASGMVETLEAMIDREFDVNLPLTEDAETPLHIACYSGQKNVVQILLRENANIDAVCVEDGKKCTPIDAARMGEHFDIVELLENFKNQRM